MIFWDFGLILRIDSLFYEEKWSKGCTCPKRNRTRYL